MPVLKHDTLPVTSENDVVLARQVVRKWAAELGFSLVDQTKIVTAASELARNALIHGGGGTVLLEALNEGSRRGLRLTFEDQGPGIPDIPLALRDGYTTGGGLGLGLSPGALEAGGERVRRRLRVGRGPRCRGHKVEVGRRLARGPPGGGLAGAGGAGPAAGRRRWPRGSASGRRGRERWPSWPPRPP